MHIKSMVIDILEAYKYPSWREIDRWTERLSAAGHTFSLGDLLIGVLAADQGALVWSLDDDFARMARLDLIRLYQ
jgi:predicted nucleic acid-binding protein